MQLVTHSRPGHPVKIIEPLSVKDADILREYWRGGLSRTTELMVEVARILSRLKERSAWLACECSGQQDLAALPIMFPREAANGRLSLARAGRRDQHDPGCVFCWEEGELGAPTVRSAAPKGGNPLRTLPYRFHDGQIVLHERSLQGGITGHLKAIISHLVAHARLNVCDGSYRPMLAQLRMLQDAAKDLTAITPEGAPLWVSISYLTEGWAHHHWQRASSATAKPAVPEQGFIVTRAKGISPGELLIKDKWVAIGCAISSEGGDIRAGEDQDEFLVAIAIVNDPATGTTRARHAYAQPLARQYLCPVDHPLQRDAMAILSIFAQEANSRYSAPDGGPLVTIEKALNDAPAWKGFRPFFVHAGQQTLVVDTMTEDRVGDFTLQRSEAHQAWRTLGPIFVDNRVVADRKTANHRLLHFLHGWIKATGVAQARVATAG